jgi:hypothetical protein
LIGKSGFDAIFKGTNISEAPDMDSTTGAIIIFGAIILIAIVMFVLEQRGVARRKAARGGREIDVSDLIAFGSAAGEGQKTKVPGEE